MKFFWAKKLEIFQGSRNSEVLLLTDRMKREGVKSCSGWTDTGLPITGIKEQRRSDESGSGQHSGNNDKEI